MRANYTVGIQPNVPVDVDIDERDEDGGLRLIFTEELPNGNKREVVVFLDNDKSAMMIGKAWKFGPASRRGTELPEIPF